MPFVIETLSQNRKSVNVSAISVSYKVPVSQPNEAFRAQDSYGRQTAPNKSARP